MIRFNHSPETIAKLKRRVCSEATRAKISAKLKGRKFSEATTAKFKGLNIVRLHEPRLENPH